MRNQGPKPRTPKKTVSIEVRVSEEEKNAFILACAAANRSASSVLRRLMGLFVGFQNLRHGINAMFNRHIFKPAGAAIAAIGAAATLSVGLLLAPPASADMEFAYQIIVDDGAGRIVSQGVAGVGPEGAQDRIADSLGETVRFEFQAEPCEAMGDPSCPQGAVHILLRVFDSSMGETVTDSGIVVAADTSGRFETRLDDGRTLSMVLQPRAER
jgi:hypothetical protein